MTGPSDWRDHSEHALYRVMGRRLNNLPGTASLVGRVLDSTWELCRVAGLDPLDECEFVVGVDEPVQINALRRKVEAMESFMSKRTLDANLTELQVYRQWQQAINDNRERTGIGIDGLTYVDVDDDTHVGELDDDVDDIDGYHNYEGDAGS